MNASELLRRSKKIGDIHAFFTFPYVHIVVRSEQFQGLEDEEREAVFAKSLNVDIAELRRTLHNALLILRLVTSKEFKDEFEKNDRNNGHHWLRAFVEEALGQKSIPRKRATTTRTIHFYGYKGGQARSTLLAVIATSLSRAGWKVLAIDSDIEAPSLDVLFGRTSRSISGTLLGAVQNQEKIQPERVFTPAETGGYVDLLACRPRSAEFDIDAAALALRAALEASIIESTANKIDDFAISQGYDLILVDHRAGLSPSTLPWMNTLPGPTVVCVRLDEQWRPAQKFIKTLLKTYLPNPGLFVSWKPDEENIESYRQRNAAQIDALLDILASATAEAAEDPNSDDGELSSVELEDHWIVWPYDAAFRLARVPESSQLSQVTVEAISKVRSLLDLDTKRLHIKILPSPSGAEDEGDLIQTEALLQLTAPENSIGYVFGRKGTGKTRLVSELTKLEIGEPLLVDSADKSGLGIKSPSPELLSAAERFSLNPDRLWWHLLAAAVAIPRTETEALNKSFKRELEDHSDEDSSHILSRLQHGTPRTFLLDGLETAFSGKTIFSYIEGLFRFLRICESDSRINSRIQCKLFLRSDLAERGYQNLEQQLFGRSINLTWDTQAILNFVLSRLAMYPWYETSFPELITQIRGKRSEILNGAVSIEDCESLLLTAFPTTLRRNNLATKTFLKTYFADSAGDKLRYYPRIFDKFLSVIADPRSAGERSLLTPQIEEGKISQRLIFQAHNAAANEYLNQLQSELPFLINFSDDSSDNQQKINTLLGAFSGLQTPFVLDECVLQIEQKVRLGESNIRSAMEKMKGVGIFEDRPDYPGQWRVGRLFKSSLRMKYGSKKEDIPAF